MYDDVLFPTDGSEGATAALDHVLEMADTHGATIHLLNVADTARDSLTQVRGEVIDALETEDETIVQEAADRASERGVDVTTDVVQGDPAETIVEVADTRGVDLIAMPTRGRRGLHRLLVGSTTERVVRTASVPVLTIRPDEDVSLRYPYRGILVPTDGSPAAEEALGHGIDLAAETDVDLRVLSVVDVASLCVDVRADVQLESLESGAREVVERATATARDAGVSPVSGAVEMAESIHQGILDYVEDNEVDLIVVGTHGRTGFDRVVIGSVTEKLIRTSPVPVLTVRERQDTE